ncbi:hypothetical protein GLW36_01575 [Halorubrum terrestre]|uniref:PQQ-binding-like beta-propeller repeat protein n=1 Tax=Halorubrum distributum TaxID=29283 RepID=A0A6B1I9C9_9EURY|nr:hypothetical protein [Halorubrum terrestre]MYL15341.1 hypothetical protein [Halorubrum terrestre]
MTGDDGRRGRPAAARRRFLAGAATALAAVTAGCGYVPGGGDLAWEATLRAGGLAFGGDVWHRATADRLVTVENRSGRSYDFEAEVWRDVSNAAVSVLTPDGTVRSVGETERQVVGEPAVADDAAFLPVERGRLTAVDLSDGGTLAATNPSGGGETTGGSTDDPVRWRVDAGSLLAAEPGGDGTDGSEDGETADGGHGAGPTLRGVRAGDALALAVGPSGIAVVDAETGDPSFAVPDLWTGESVGAVADPMSRVAVDGETVWALAPEDAAVGGDRAAIVGYDRGGGRIAERAVAGTHEWLVAVDGTVAVGAPGASFTGYDRTLDRRFALDARAPGARPTAVPSGAGRLYYSRGQTLTAVDVAAGEVAFERSNLPPGHLAADATGAYLTENGGGFNGETDARMVAVGADGSVEWEAPFPDGIEPEEVFAFGGRLVALDGDTAYGFRATPGERWSPLG